MWTFSLLAAVAAHGAANVPDFVNSIEARAVALYAPVAAAATPPETFRIDHRPESDLIVASASRNPLRDFRVVVDGGFLRAARLDADTYRFALCHEIGHLFGGAPRRPAPEEWDGPVLDDGLLALGGEGTADYYAGLTCFRALTEGEDHAAALRSREVPPALRRACAEGWGSGTSEAMGCERAGLGAFGLLRLVREFPLDFASPDLTRVDRTLTEYPSRQCRLDTAVAGAVCRASTPLALDPYVAEKSGCLSGPGARPACWYRSPSARPLAGGARLP